MMPVAFGQCTLDAISTEQRSVLILCGCGFDLPQFEERSLDRYDVLFRILNTFIALFSDHDLFHRMPRYNWGD